MPTVDKPSATAMAMETAAAAAAISLSPPSVSSPAASASAPGVVDAESSSSSSLLSLSSSSSASASASAFLASCSSRQLAVALVSARGSAADASRLVREASRLLEEEDGAGNGSGTTSHSHSHSHSQLVSPDASASASATTNATTATAAATPTTTAATTATATAAPETSLPCLSSLGKPLLTEPFETSILTPRMGRCLVQVYERGIVATKKNDSSVRLVLGKNNESESESESEASTTTGSSSHCNGNGNGNRNGNCYCYCSHVLVFPKPEDCKAIVHNRTKCRDDPEAKPKKNGGRLVVLHLASQSQSQSQLKIPKQKQKSPIRTICFVLPVDPKTKAPLGVEPFLSSSLPEDDNDNDNDNDNHNDNGDRDDPTGAWARLLHGALGGKLAEVLPERKEDGSETESDEAFASHRPPNTSTTTAGMPYVSCYLGVNDGVVYPLAEGLLFYKPPRFVPSGNLHSIACGRGRGGESSSRYVDLVVQCRLGDNDNDMNNNNNNDSNDNNDNNNSELQLETIEFTNIRREETGVLNTYIHDVLIPSMTRDAKATTASRDSRGSGSGDDDNDDDDNNNNNNNNNSSDDDEVVAEAVVDEDDDDDATEVVRGEGSDSEDSDEDYREADSDDDDDDDGNGSEDTNDDDEDDDNDIDGLYGGDNEGVAVVADDFARELAKRNRNQAGNNDDDDDDDNDDDSATESEEETGSRPRESKRLRRRRGP